MRILDLDTSRLPVASQPLPPSHHAGHLLSRRAFLGGTAGVSAAAVGAVIGGGLLGPTAAFAAPKSPNPVPKPTAAKMSLNGQTFSLTGFGPGMDPSSITDFNGFVGVADVQGTGTATYIDGTTEPLLYDTDMRFMKGVYVAKDGRVYQGTFGFV